MEALFRAKGNETLRADYRRIAERRAKYKARGAVARHRREVLKRVPFPAVSAEQMGTRSSGVFTLPHSIHDRRVGSISNRDTDSGAPNSDR